MPSAEAEAAEDAAREELARVAALLRSGASPAQSWAILANTTTREEWAVAARRAARALEAGDEVPVALGSVGPGPGEDPRGGHASGHGSVLVSGLGSDPAQHPGRAWPVAAWACTVATRTGAPLAPLLERVAEDAGARADASRARTAGEAGARSTRRILAWLPVGGILLAQLLGADPLGVLTGTLAGRVSALIGLGFWVAALLWSRRILARPAGGAE